MHHNALRRSSALFILTLACLSFSSLLAQSRSRFLEPRRAGAFELSGAALFLTDNAQANLVKPGTEWTWLGRSSGPIHSGFRLGVHLLDRSESGSDAEPGFTERRRVVLPEVSGVLRLDPSLGGFRPFFEGECGMSATGLEVRTFDPDGGRTDHQVPALDPTLHLGWGAGFRARIGHGIFLTARYGERYGGQLNLHFEGLEVDAPRALEGKRQTASLGLSLAL